MKRSRLNAAILLSVLPLASCASLNTWVSGLFSKEDIREVRFLVEHCDGFKGPIRTIARVSDSRALVQTGRCSESGGYCVSIPLTKRHGKWRVEEVAVKAERIIVNSSPRPR